VNQKNKSDCLALHTCGWDAEKGFCIGKELLDECTTTTTTTTTTASVTYPLTVDRSFGNNKCPCIGLDNITGVTTALILGRLHAHYPADLGAHCAAWDNGMHPISCKEHQEPGMGNAWCAQQWCFVDPCNCDIDSKPKPSTYLPAASYQGKPLFYSYATCGDTDTWKSEASPQENAIENLLCDPARHQPVFGKEECKCIGISGEPGFTNVTISGHNVVYPADTGTSCKAWDMDSNPECTGHNYVNKPDWCGKPWCYVDPCSCPLAVPPKTTAYLPDATFQGRAIYYSYDTCGSEDSWTAENHAKACTNKKSIEDCLALTHCGWEEKKAICMGKDLLEACPTSETLEAPEHADHHADDRVADEKAAAFIAAPIISVLVVPTLTLLKMA